MMRLLITGGAGFIGSHIAERALKRDWTVGVLDDLSSGRRDNVPTGAEFFEVDIRDQSAVAAAFADFKPTAVSHQAAQASVAISVREPQLDAAINITGSLNILTSCVTHNVERIVFASTGGAIYGEVPPGQKASVDFNPVPISPYACSKLSVEKYLECFRQEHGLNYTILRYANVYGPRQDPHGEAGVVAIFCNRILAGESIRVNAMKQAGDDGCIRDYVYIDDVAGANLAALAGEISDPILNVGTGCETTTRQLADILQQKLDNRIDVQPADKRPGDIERSVLNVDRLVELRGPVTGIEDGLAATAAWFQDRAAKN